MKRRYKVLGAIAGVFALGLAALAVALSHESACQPAPAVAGDALLMTAAMGRCYGPPEVLTVEQTARPTAVDDRVLVRVHAASANPLDWHTLRGRPYFMRLSSGIGTPQDPRVGADFAGVVEAIGPKVTRFKPGDEVFGAVSGAFADYVTVREARIAIKPPNMSFEQAASVPVAAITALQSLRDKGQLKAGQKVLINGASGGVGTFAVQIAKALGAEVTGVCSTRNVELVKSIGADHVIDYTQQDFTAGAERYDVIVDTVGNHGLLRVRGALTPQGALVVVGSLSDEAFLGPGWRFLTAAIIAPFVDQRIETILADVTSADLGFLAELMQTGKLTPVIDRSFALADSAEAIRYLETGRARGKVIIDVP